MIGTSGWDVIRLATPAEQSLGVKQFPSPLPLNYLLFFTDVVPGSVVNMRGVQEPLQYFFLDHLCRRVGGGVLNPEYGASMVPYNASHLVEISAQAQPPQNFDFLMEYFGL